MRRPLVLAGRIVLWAAVGLVLVRGVVSIVSPAKATAPATVRQSAGESFPKDEAAAFAAPRSSLAARGN